MGYLETIKYHSHFSTLNSYMYKGEIVQIITIFTDTNLALVEGTNENIFEILTNKLEPIK